MPTCLAAGIVCAGLLVFAPLRVQADATSSPGKFAAATTRTDVDLSTDPVSVTATVQLATGKKKRLLVVNVTAATDSYDGRIQIGIPTANGVDMEPQGVFALPSCGDINTCGIAGTWWLDIDAAETANPGMFSGVPVVVIAKVTPGPNVPLQAGATLTMSLVAQQVKK